MKSDPTGMGTEEGGDSNGKDKKENNNDSIQIGLKIIGKLLLNIISNVGKTLEYAIHKIEKEVMDTADNTGK